MTEKRLDIQPGQPISFDIDQRNAPKGASMDKRVASESDESDQAHENAVAIEAFLKIEHWLTIGIGLVLVIATLLALSATLVEIWNSARHWPESGGVFGVVDHLLFVLMLVEILHTVRASISTNKLAIEPFLIVGLIACVRRILVVTLESSNASNGTPAPPFDHEMIELGVLGFLTLVLISSIFLSRKSRQLTSND